MNYVRAVDFYTEEGDDQWSKFDQILGYGMLEEQRETGKSYNLYAVTNTTIAKVSYMFDSESNSMTYSVIEKNITDQFILDGSLVKAELSKTDFVISCADCS